MTGNLYQSEFQDWGLIEYQEAYQRQKLLMEDVAQHNRQYLIVCEHPVVLTCGRMTKAQNLLVKAENLAEQGIKVQRVDRGGDVTLHAPGQLVIYPILNLNNYGRDLHWFLRKLEQVVIDLLSEFDIVANRFPGYTGVWVGDEKIASIGIGVRKWLSYHGIGLNVNTDLELFDLIRPCGLNVKMTSLKKIKKQVMDLILIKDKFKKHFKKEFLLDWKV